MIDPKALRLFLNSEIRQIKEKEVGISLSSGIDSTSLLISALEAKKTPIAFSFRLENVRSSDFIIAEENSRRLGIEHREILLSEDLEKLAHYVSFAIGKLGLHRKAEIECFWPVKTLLDQVKIPMIFGHGADGYFGLSKRAMIHYRDRLDEFRTLYFAKKNYAQRETIESYARENARVVSLPYAKAEKLLPLFRGSSQYELNQPRQKELIRKAFEEEFSALKLKRHTNLQLGDSGIAELFDQLARLHQFRTPIGFYNSIARGGGRK